MFVDNEPHDACGKSQPRSCVEVLINTGWVVVVVVVVGGGGGGGGGLKILNKNDC